VGGAEGRVIGVNKFSEAVKTKEATGDEGNEEEVIVGWPGIGTGKTDEVKDGEGQLARRGMAQLPRQPASVHVDEGGTGKKGSSRLQMPER
jgi:hypothetical protein